jgi:signal transduction histidine kinase
MTIRSALLLGLALLLALWSASDLNISRRLLELERRSVEINTQFVNNQARLSAFRSNVFLSAIYLRDALLDTVEEPEFYRDHLLETQRRSEEAVRGFTPGDNAEQRLIWQSLRREFDVYWAAVLPVLNWDPAKRAADARSFLRREIIPRREWILRMSEQIETLNAHTFDAQRGQLIELHNGLRSMMWWTGGLTVLLGTVIAVLLVRYAARLERGLMQKHAEVLSSREDLQRLSNRLVHVQEDERRIIARELHDEVGQALTAIKMELAAARTAPGDGRQQAALEAARAIVDRTLQSVRDLSQLLHPAVLDDLGLSEAVRGYLRGFSRRTGIRADLVEDRLQVRLPADVELCAYRVIQEALTNVARHSQARACRVLLQRLPHTLLVSVEDDGRGFDTASLEAPGARTGLGLLGIKERVSGLGGVFRLESRAGGGTRLSLELPIPAAVEGPPEPVPAG